MQPFGGTSTFGAGGGFGAPQQQQVKDLILRISVTIMVTSLTLLFLTIFLLLNTGWWHVRWTSD